MIITVNKLSIQDIWESILGRANCKETKAPQMNNPEVQLETLKLVVLEVEKERARLHNRIPQSRMERDSIGEERASNKAKLEVLHQLFGYDFIQGIIDKGVTDGPRTS